MFQPFSQENPLHTGTGLGLAIVNSIVKSEGIRGKVDVYSTEGVGTEIRVTIEAEPPSRSSSARQSNEESGPLTQRRLIGARVSPISFRPSHRGQNLLREVLSSYLTWWDATIAPSSDDANILLVNEDIGIVDKLIQERDIARPVVLLASHRGDGELSRSSVAFEKIGGVCHIVYKPVRPSHLFKALERALAGMDRTPSGLNHADALSPLWRPPLTQRPSLFSAQEVTSAAQEAVSASLSENTNGDSSIQPSTPPIVHRRHSEERPPVRRPLLPHSLTYQHFGKSDKLEPNTVHESPSKPLSPLSPSKTKDGTRSARVLIVEDNHVNRALLAQWLKKQVSAMASQSP